MHPGKRLPAIVAIAIVATSTVLALAAERPSDLLCKREALPGRGYIECLEGALRDSDAALKDAHAAAITAIEAREDLIVTQRNRWKNTLDEAHGLFIRYRNYECQNVAPYEGRGGRIGAFEERLACLVDRNTIRAEELRRRYGGG